VALKVGVGLVVVVVVTPDGDVLGTTQVVWQLAA
jgi:hypothetical protein